MRKKWYLKEVPDWLANLYLLFICVAIPLLACIGSDIIEGATK